MKILFFTRKLDPHYKSWCGMPHALSTYADVKFYGPGFENSITSNEIKQGKKIDVLKVIAKLYPKDYPDIVIQGDAQMKGLFYALDNFHYADCLRVMWMIDLHNCVGRPKVIKYVEDGNIDIVLKAVDVNNITEWGKKLENTGVDVLWYPHSFDDKVFYDRNLPKIFDVTNIGLMSSQCYPTRLKMHQFFADYKVTRKNGKKIVEVKGMSDYNGGKQVNKVKNGIKYHWSNLRGEAYSKDINKSKIFATGCSSYSFPLQKFFEVMACKTLLMSNTPMDSKELGFIPEVNFAEIKGHPKQVSEVKVKDFLGPIKYYLGHPDEAMKISKSGHDLVHSRHTHEIRAKQLIETLKKHI